MQRLREVDPETAEVFDALIALTAQLVRSLGEHGADETVATFRERFWHDKGLSTPEGRSEALAWLEEQNR